MRENMFVWIVTLARFGGDSPEFHIVEVAKDEAAARQAVQWHADGEPGVHMDDWVVRKEGDDGVSVGLEGDDAEVTATRWKVFDRVTKPR